jgi:hypothetical protein
MIIDISIPVRIPKVRAAPTHEHNFRLSGAIY